MADSAKRTPFWAAVKEYVQSRVYPFHTPAHKQGRFGDLDFLDQLGAAARFDLDPPLLALDHAPADLVHEAERLAAEAYRADRTFFLVNGSTQGIHAGLLALGRPGEPIIVPRHSHRSVAAGLTLAGAEPLFINTSLDPTWGIPRAVNAADVRRAVQTRRASWVLMRPDAVVNAVLTHPNYWGLAEPVREVATVIEETGGVLMCDEAHGAHLPFLNRGPHPALGLGATITVQSPHKMLGSFVQSAWMHVKGVPPDLFQRLAAAMALVSTSSPSFLLLSSLDATRRWAVEHGREQLEAAADLVGWVRDEISRLDEIAGLTASDAKNLGYTGLDPLKLTIAPRTPGFSGLHLAAYLREQHGIQVEMANPLSVTMIFSPGDSREAGGRLVEALAEFARGGRVGAQAPGDPAGSFDADEVRELLAAWPALDPVRVMSFREAVFSRCRAVPLTKAAGLVAAAAVAPYPPGIPILYPGERIESHVTALLLELAERGLHIDGVVTAGGEPAINVVEDLM